MDNKNDYITHFSAVDDEDRQSSDEAQDKRKEPSFGDDCASLYVKSDSGNKVSPSFGEENAHESSFASSQSFSINKSSDKEESLESIKVDEIKDDINKIAESSQMTEKANMKKDNKEDSQKNNKKNKASKDSVKKNKDPKSMKKRFVLFSLKSFAAALAIIFLLFIYFDSVVLSKFGVDDKWVLPAVVYSRPLELYPDQKLSLKEMEYELELLKYRKVKNPRIPGEYAVNASASRIVLIRRPFDFPDAKEDKIALVLDFNDHRVASILNADTREDLGYVRMDPVLLDRINRIDPTEDRIFIQLSDVPPALITTLLEIEDRSFKTNCGVNFLAIGRAFVKNTLAGGVVEGGSTITQQLVKNYFLNSERSYIRKFKEIIMALIMNHRYTKDQILEAYMNEIYLGQNGKAGVYGFGLASYFYFGVPVSELTLDQMALLVGIIKGPSYYDPWRHPEKALQRRDVVLSVLKKRNVITQTAYEQYTARPLGVIKRGSMNYSKTPAFMGVLKKEIASKKEFGPDFLSGNGIKIFTSLDPQSQKAAENAVEKELNAIERETGRKGLEAAMVVSSWRTAEVSAVVGSRTPQYAGFNRVLEGRRQVGSIIKPFVYLTAFHNGIHLGTMVNDVPISIKLSNGKLWQPKNDDKQTHGLIPTYVAMARSMNIPTVKIGMRVGLNNVRQTLMNVGLEGNRIPNYPSLFLGTIELTPFEVAQIYSSLATDGAYKDLTTLRTVVKDGKIVYERSNSRLETTIDPKDSYLTLYVMMQATKIGTGRRIGRLFPNVNIATKTGTTNDNRDTWTVGIDSDQVVATWVGFDDNKSTGLFGASGAMRVYGRFLTERGVNSLELNKPDGIKFVNFNQEGNIVSDECLIPNLNYLPARIDKIRYVKTDCAFSAGSEYTPVPFSPFSN